MRRESWARRRRPVAGGMPRAAHPRAMAGKAEAVAQPAVVLSGSKVLLVAGGGGAEAVARWAAPLPERAAVATASRETPAPRPPLTGVAKVDSPARTAESGVEAQQASEATEA